MADIDRDALRKLAEAATPGPWEIDPDGRTINATESDGESYAVGEAYDLDVPTGDAAFIATARTALPALLDALDAAEAEVARLRERFQEAKLGMHASAPHGLTCADCGIGAYPCDACFAALDRARKGGT